MALILALLVPIPVAAQTTSPDFCSGSLPYQTDPGEVTKFRQTCTIQKLLAERADEAMLKTAAEVSVAVEAAHAKAQTDALAEERERAAALAEYWKGYVIGIEARLGMLDKYPTLAMHLDETCAWHGTFNAPTARMCKAWHAAGATK